MPRIIFDTGSRSDLAKLLDAARPRLERLPSGERCLGRGKNVTVWDINDPELSLSPRKEKELGILVGVSSKLQRLAPQQVEPVLRRPFLLVPKRPSPENVRAVFRTLQELAGAVEATSTDDENLELRSAYLFAYTVRNDTIVAPPEVAFSFDLALAGLAGRKPGHAHTVLAYLGRAIERRVEPEWVGVVRQVVLESFPDASNQDELSSAVQRHQLERPRLGRELFLTAFGQWLALLVGFPRTREEIQLKIDSWIREEEDLLDYITSKFKKIRKDRALAELIGEFELDTPDEIRAAERLDIDGWGRLSTTSTPAVFEVNDAIIPGTKSGA